jgi:hypothetical protein
MRPSFRLRGVAWLNVVVHAVGLGMALKMRPGTPLVPLEERMTFLAAAPLGWQLGWAVWALAALALLAYFVILSEYLDSPVRRAALACVAAAIAVDLSCDSLQIVLLPMAAHGQAGIFLLIERAVGLLGTLIANGLYTLAAVLVTFRLRRPIDRILGAALGAAGAAMCVGGLLDLPRVIEISTGPTIILYCGWAISLAYSLERA